MTKCLLAVLLLCFPLTALAVDNPDSLRVDENSTRFLLSETLPQVVLAVENPRAANRANVEIELIAPDDAVKASVKREVDLTLGANEIALEFDLQTSGDLSFDRLRYRIAANDETTTGVIAVANIAADLFEIETADSRVLSENQRYFVRVSTLQPILRRAVANVKIQGEIKIGFKDKTAPSVITAEAVTDADGAGLLAFQMPADVRKVDDATLKITATKKHLTRTATNNNLQFLDSQFGALMQTDKPLYQPGQSLKARALLMRGERRIVPNQSLIFKIKDPEDTTVQRIEAATSRFGVTAIEWQIPENAKLGDYHIEVEGDDDQSFERNRTSFKVSRYDLPNFTVKAETDKKFYLPNEKSARVTVNADYLFGQAVTRAKVRIVRETEREWNYEAQKYDVKEGEAHEGEVGADGKFAADFDLTDEFKDIKHDENYSDLRLTAYVTDLTTNRTEQKRFDVRVSKEPIHVYLVGDIARTRESRRLPANYYVSTFYADGTPANCAVKIYHNKESNENEKPRFGKLLARGTTNKNGAGKILFPFDGVSAEDDYEFNYIIVAEDAQKQRGTKLDWVYLRNRAAIQIETDKTVYRAGEPIKIKVVSSEKNAKLFVDVSRGYGQILRTAQLKLTDGAGELTIAYQPDFKREINIAAYAETLDEDRDLTTVSAIKTVVFPTPFGLRVNAATDKKVFRPNETAKVNFTAARADGQTGEAALGVVVSDKAIETRAANDGDNADAFASYRRLLGYESLFGGWSAAAINNLDLSKPIAPEDELAIEIAIRQSYPIEFERERNFERAFANAYEPIFTKQFAPVGNSLNNGLTQEAAPINETEFRQILQRANINFDDLRDPFGTRFRAKFEVNTNYVTVTIQSAGADKKFDTSDDLTAFERGFQYFAPIGFKIDRAAREFNERTDEFIRDYKTLRAEVLRQNVDLNKLRDFYGRPYKFVFGVNKENFTIRVRSAGKNGKHETDKDYDYKYDDFTVWTNSTDYFAVLRSGIARKFAAFVREKQTFPTDEAGFKTTLQSLGFDLDKLTDVYKHLYYVKREESARYADKVQIRAANSEKVDIKPVTQKIVTYKIRSAGADGIAGSDDDFDLANFNGVVTEQSKDDATAKKPTRQIATTDKTGAISGLIVDVQGAVIPNATIKIERNVTKTAFTATTDNEGRFEISNLPPGIYQITVEAIGGFARSIVQNVEVRAANITEINLTLNVGAAANTVDVVASSAEIQTSQSSASVTVNVDASVGTNKTKSQPFVAKGNDGEDTGKLKAQLETPRLREYFPETLVWQPEIVTDQNGRASLDFKLADSLTTWKMAVIGSTVDGEVGVSELEIKTFQPFFAELEPPKILTENDRIQLPVTLRNYTDKPQSVTATMDKAAWFELLNQPQQSLEVAPNTARNAVFDLRAVASIKNGKQRVTAIGSDASDAIEKPVTVHPNGREIETAQGAIFSDNASFDVNFPTAALPNTKRAELKIYPNLMSHVTESIEGILQRPHGCAEQTISSAYPSLLLLRSLPSLPSLPSSADLKNQKKSESNLNSTNSANSPNSANSANSLKALKYLRFGYERLLNYRAEGGGFNYWGRGEADLALSAYALRFLLDAQEFVAVDNNLIKQTREFLIKNQTSDGGWKQKYQTANDAQLTAFIARILARFQTDEAAKTAVNKALARLEIETAKIDEPYLLANYALALFEANQTAKAQIVAARLETLAKFEGAGAFWNLETNTPFYGWGRAGRIETTALVLQALSKANPKSKIQNPKLNAALQFLLKNKDAYGVWYSTQATVNVLDALVSIIEKMDDKPVSAEILINGKTVKTVALDNKLHNPTALDLTEFLTNANNRVEIRAANRNAISANVVQNYYTNWQDENGFRASDSDAVRLQVDYDKTTANINEEITCRVRAERVGFTGYGMLLAEIGLPPGAQVSRESLDKAVADSNYNIGSYEILPDKVIFYLWARSGGSNFQFKFKPRFGLEANTAPAQIYDYYNPTAHVVLAPTRFVIK